MTGTSNYTLKLQAVLIAALIFPCHSRSNTKLEDLGLMCSTRDTCQGNLNNLTDIARSCKCDEKCILYNDCCIDSLMIPRAHNSTYLFTCLPYGNDINTGVYVISECNSEWNGSNEVREKCVGNINFTDLRSAAPITGYINNITYRNIACAKCNNADLTLMKSFEPKVKCDGLEGLKESQMIANLTYNKEHQVWGVYRSNKFGNATEFFGCDITFDIPKELENKVRSCHSNLISTCAIDWTDLEVEKLCAQYLSKVYIERQGYRNPHCAICNHKALDEISCKDQLLSRQRRDACESGWIWDPFAKRCRKLVCAIPGRILVNGKCVPAKS